MTKDMCSTLTATVLLAGGVMLATVANGQQTPAAATPPATSSTPAKTAATKAPASSAQSKSPLELNTEKEKFSYAIGMNMGANFKRQSVPIDPVILERGVKDAIAGGKMLLTDAEAQAAIEDMKKEVTKIQQEKNEKAGATNKKAGADFLAENKGKPGVVALPDGLQYKILKEGTGPKPTTSDKVVCNYRGTLIDGTEFDASSKHGGPSTFPVTGVIKGWTEALQLMPVGSKWELYIPSDLAYGDRSMVPDITPNSTLVFEIELVSIEDKKETAPEKK